MKWCPCAMPWGAWSNKTPGCLNQRNSRRTSHNPTLISVHLLTSACVYMRYRIQIFKVSFAEGQFSMRKMASEYADDAGSHACGPVAASISTASFQIVYFTGAALHKLRLHLEPAP